MRPSFVEYSVRRTPGGSVRDHYLTRYQKAFGAVMEANFSAERDEGTELATFRSLFADTDRPRKQRKRSRDSSSRVKKEKEKKLEIDTEEDEEKGSQRGPPLRSTSGFGVPRSCDGVDLLRDQSRMEAAAGLLRCSETCKKRFACKSAL